MGTVQQRLYIALMCGVVSYAIAFSFSSGDVGVRIAAAVFVVAIYGAMFLVCRRVPRVVAGVSFLLALAGVTTTRRDTAFLLVFVFSVAEAFLSASVLLARVTSPDAPRR